MKDGSTQCVDDIEIVELPEGEHVAVYNFEVADFRTYFVSDYDVLVHNQCKKKDIDVLQNGSNGTTVSVQTKKDANKLLHEAFPNYKKVRGVGSQEPSGLRKN